MPKQRKITLYLDIASCVNTNSYRNTIYIIYIYYLLEKNAGLHSYDVMAVSIILILFFKNINMYRYIRYYASRFNQRLFRVLLGVKAQHVSADVWPFSVTFSVTLAVRLLAAFLW